MQCLTTPVSPPTVLGELISSRTTSGSGLAACQALIETQLSSVVVLFFGYRKGCLR